MGFPATQSHVCSCIIIFDDDRVAVAVATHAAISTLPLFATVAVPVSSDVGSVLHSWSLTSNVGEGMKVCAVGWRRSEPETLVKRTENGQLLWDCSLRRDQSRQ